MAGKRFGCDSAIRLLRLLEDPRVGHVDDLGHEGQVVASKTFRGLPVVPVLVEALDGDVVASAGLGVVCPDGGLDGAEAYLMNGPSFFLALSTTAL